jgi:hypothetical protein
MNGLVGLWHMNESVWADVANEVIDSSGAGNHGRAKNSAQTSHLGRFNRSGYFDGVNDYIDLGNSLSLQLSTVTVSAWFKTANAGTSHRNIVCKQGAYCLSLLNNQLSLYDWGAPAYRNTGLMPNDDRWHHLVVSFKSGIANGTEIYLDGDLKLTTTITFTGQNVAAQIGWGNWPGQNFTGFIDEVAIWNRALNADEVKELYRRGANRVKFQVRTCVTSNCNDNPTWLGPNGSNSPLTYFSEIHNNTSFSATGNPTGRVIPEFPDLNFSWFTNLVVPGRQFFQYRAILESDDTSNSCDYGSGATWCSPELQGVTVRP